MRIIFLTFVALIFVNAPAHAGDKILDIQEIKSAGGVTAWLVEDDSLPVISFKFSFRGAGSIRDGVEKQGLARLLSNTMDEGAGELPSQEFQKALSDYSIALYFNSGRDNFGGQLKTLSRNKDKAFELLTLALTSPRFDAEPVERMRQANITRVRSSMGNPDWIAARLFNDIAFAGHPYALNSGGTLSTLKNINVMDFKKFMKDWLTKDRLIVGVTGDIKAAELSILLDQVFGSLPDTGKQDKIKDHRIQNNGKVFHYNKDIPQTIISSAIPSIDNKDPDYYALKIMNYIFGSSGFGSRLMNEAREKRGLTYGIYSGLLAQDHLDALTISTSTKHASTLEMTGIIEAEIEKMTKTPVSADELQDAQSYITGSMPLALTSTGKVSGILLALQLNGRPIDYLDNFSARINSVTIKDVQNIAKRIFNAEKMTTIMVGRPQEFKNLKIIETLPNVE